MTRLMTLGMLSTMLGAFGCGDDTSVETDPDTDTTPPPTEAFTVTGGTLSYAEVQSGFDTAGEVTGSCAAEYDLGGTEYIGDCANCDWAIEFTATETSSDCAAPDSVLTFDASNPNGLPVLGYWTAFSAAYGDYKVFGIGWPYVYGTETYWDWGNIAYLSDGTTAGGTGTYNIAGTAIDWTASARTTDDGNPVFGNQDCAAAGTFTEGDALVAGAGIADDLPCDGSVVDVWEFTATAGGTVQISVDTVAADSAFDPYLYINDGDTCTAGTADDSFACTFPPPQYTCPAASYTFDAAGTYQIVVGSFGNCAAGTTAADLGLYTIMVDGAAATLVNDDAIPVDSRVVTDATVMGTATVSVAL